MANGNPSPMSEVQSPTGLPAWVEADPGTASGFRTSHFRPPDDLLIAGLGNVLLRDDGVGVHAVRELQRRPPAGATVVEIGTAVLHGLSFVEGAHRILLIDAMQAGQSPGTIYLCEMQQGSAGSARPASPPLTLALSPDRTEADPLGPSAHAFSKVSVPAASPLNGGRAGVRGGNVPQAAGQGRPMHSLHSLSLLEALRVFLPHSPLRPVTVIGVEPAALDYGLSLSPAVAAALPRVVALARRVVGRWQHDAGSAASAALASHRCR